MDRTFGRRRRLLDYRTRFDNQHPAINQARGDRMSSPREDPGIGLSRHSHAFGRGVLIEPGQVRETNCLEFVQADGDRVTLAREASDRSEAPTLQLAADAARENRAGHAVQSICS